jgi:hypothetical protein
MHLTFRLILVATIYGACAGLCASLIDSSDPPPRNAGEPLGEWWFVPNPALPGRASANSDQNTSSQRPGPLVDVPHAPMRFSGQLPTQRRLDLWAEQELPQKSFSVEMWAMYHVDQPVGAVAAVRGSNSDQPIPWLLSFYDWEAKFRIQLADQREIQLQHRLKTWSGFKERWVHLVATFEQDQVQLYLNGERVASEKLESPDLAWPKTPSFEVAAYMENEPYMQLENLVRQVAVWDSVLEPTTVEQRFQTFCQQVEQGITFPDQFHFTAPPYLNLSSPKSMNLLWETDRDSTAVLRWGTTAALENTQTFAQSQRLHETSLMDLQPNTTYFYQVTCESEGAQPLDSGLLSFRTAVNPGEPFRFAILGDTESRPHVNRQLAHLIWGERPHFVVNLGDLTDAGMEPHRYEWTQEYFLGIGALHSRIPVFPVPGNGEGDLFWYRHYHRLPDPEGYYRFQYGDIDFFMLDSNQRETDFSPDGKQYQWLEQQLKTSTAKWKVVCHHHATYTSEEDDYGDSWREASTYGDRNVRPLVPLCERHGVDLMMFGHLHLYERSFPIREGKIDLQQGTVHLLAGGGGGNLEDFGPTPAWFSAKTYRGHHYLMCEAKGDQLTFQMYDLDGRLRDQWNMSKD